MAIFTLTDSNAAILAQLNGIAGNSQYNIVTSVAGGNLTVALKDKYGNDFSASNPGYFKIGDTVRTITGACSFTTNAGTSWLNLGSAELATKEVDLFAYIVYSTSSNSVVPMSSRYSSARLISDFDTSGADKEKGVIGSVVNNTDQVECIGRFNAILSGGAYTWSIPATSIIISRPIYETRWLTWVPRWIGGGGSVGTYATTITSALYKISGSTVSVGSYSLISNLGSWSGVLEYSLPLVPNGGVNVPLAGSISANATNPVTAARGMPYFVSTGIRFLSSTGSAEIQWSALATGDVIFINGQYPI